jgi:uncharacterized protein (DUF58 family)
MTILSFKSKKDKEMLYEKAKKMEKYASMIVDCLEEAGYNDEYEEDYKRMYRDHEEDMRHEDYAHDNRYNYKRGMRY